MLYFSIYSPVKMKKCVIFHKNAIAKTLINQVIINIEVCDKHEIEAFAKSFNLICLNTKFPNLSTSKSFKIFRNLKFLFKKPTLLQYWKRHQNCSLSWTHIWKVSFRELNVILFFFFVLFHRSFKIFLILQFLNNLLFLKFWKNKKKVHYISLTDGKFHSGIWICSYFSSLFCFTDHSKYFFNFKFF
jgi:hypothetical protein